MKMRFLKCGVANQVDAEDMATSHALVFARALGP